MARKRVTVLYEVWWPEKRPAGPGALVREASAKGTGSADASTDGPEAPDEPDVHAEVYRALARLGYRPHYSVLEGDTLSLERLMRLRSSLVFNLTESYAGDDTKDMHVAAFLEMLGKPFTGSGPRALHLGQDKALAKKLLRFHGVPTAEFYTVDSGNARFHNELPFPLIVKPSREDGSIGIDAGSVVHDVRSLRRRVRYVHETFSGPALVERYIDGRELYVGIVGNESPEALPLVELDFRRVPEGVPRIAGTEVKWWSGNSIYKLTPAVYPRGLTRTVTRRVHAVALSAYQAIGVRDYGRIDIRLAADGVPYVLEVNPNPWLASECELFMAWKKTGRSYDELIARIIELAAARATA